MNIYTMSNTEIILTKTKGNTNPEDVLEALRKKKKNKFSITILVEI